jgi:DNA polymerase-3 subunit beta
MKITCDREKLLSAVQLAGTVAPARSPKPILEKLKLDVAGETGVLMATDMEIGVRVDVPNLRVEAAGAAIFPKDRLLAILRESSDESLGIESDGQGITIRGRQSEFNLPAENPDEFPAVTGFAETKYHEVSARLLREIIRRTAFATDVESTRYALGGVFLELNGEQMIAVATDGRRLAKMEGKGQAIGDHNTSQKSPIVPTKAMLLIEKSLGDGEAEVRLAVRNNDVLVRTSRATIYARLAEGRFPRWRDVFPDTRRAVKMDLLVGPFAAVVRQAAIVTDANSRGLDFTFGDGKLVVSARTAEVGQSRIEMPISYDGEAILITLDARFMLDFLKCLEPEKSFTLQVINPDTAAVCTTDDGYAYLVMPLSREK